MHIANGRLIASPTDLANFLVCRHKTALDLRVAAGVLDKPLWVDPLADLLRKRGQEHEDRYVAVLRLSHSIDDASRRPSHADRRRALQRELLTEEYRRVAVPQPWSEKIRHLLDNVVRLVA